MSRIAIVGRGVIGSSRAPGPVETIDIDAPTGVADPRAWMPSLVGAVEAERRGVTPAEGLTAFVAADRRMHAEACARASRKDA